MTTLNSLKTGIFKGKKFLSLVAFTCFFILFAQGQPNILIFNDDFTLGSGNFSLNGGGIGANNGNNQWVVNSNYTGAPLYPNTNSQLNTVAGTISFPNTNYLHIHDNPNAGVVSNANFDPASTSDRLAVLNAGICTMGFTNVRFSFFYLCEGNPAAYGSLYFSRNGGAWQQIGQPQYNSQTLWKYEILTNPGFNNANDLRFAFRWNNTAGAPPSNMSFAVDDIFVLGDYDLMNPVTINITSVPAQVCQGTNLVFSFALSDTLCDGQYSIQLYNPGGGLVNTWAFNMYYPQTQATLAINIAAGTPVGACYTLRVNRISPPPAITGTISICFAVIACPNTITTLQPVVTIGSEAPNGIGVCVGSVIDVPFWSTGSFFPGNVYTAQLSDPSGGWGAPLTIGTFASLQAFDPTVVPSPGNVSGIIPPTVDGCGYFIRVRSSSPNTIGTVWGPFCIKNCDITTNNHQDISFCISSTLGDTGIISYTINTAPIVGVTYAPGNQFLVEVLNSMTFAQVNIGVIGSVTSTTSGNIQINIPPLPGLLALGMQPGMYYIRVVATASSAPNNALGSLIRMTIGAPYDGPNPIIATTNTICYGTSAIVFFYLGIYNPQSTYQWYLNGSPFPNYPTYPLGVQFNGLPGYYIFTVQETNFGCVGPMSPPDTVAMITAPNANIQGPLNVCFGDTSQYNVSWIPNTAYGWSLNPPGAGTILINGADYITIAWDQVPSGSVTLVLNYATNMCGSATGSVQISINPKPTANAGPDKTICEGQTVSIGGSPSGSGGTPGYTYAWTPAGSVAPPGGANPSASPLVTTDYVLLVTDTKQCKDRDTVQVIVNPLPLINFPSDTGYCDGLPFLLDAGNPGGTYNWNTGATSQTLSVTSSGNYSVTVTLPTGCTATDAVNVEVHPMPSAEFTTDLPCIVEPVVFHNNSTIVGDIISVNDWSFGDGNSSLVVEPTYQYASPGFYDVWLQVTTPFGCTDSIMHTIEVHPPAAPPTIFNDTVCYGFPALLIADPGVNTYLTWYYTQADPNFFHTGNFYNVPPLNMTTTFFIEPVEPGGCRGVMTPITAYVNPTPNGTIIATPRLSEIPNAIIEFNFDPQTLFITSLHWEFGDGGSSDLWNPVHQYNEAGIYDITLHLIDANGCEAILVYKEWVTVVKNIRIYAPNTFTPNGDGLNDYFSIGTRLVTDLHIQIFDRWGMLLFESMNLDFKWDGKDIKGADLPEGVYIYNINAQGFDGSPLELKGTITLVR